MTETGTSETGTNEFQTKPETDHEKIETFTLAELNMMFEQLRKSMQTEVRTDVRNAVNPSNKDPAKQLPDRDNCNGTNFYPF